MSRRILTGDGGGTSYRTRCQDAAAEAKPYYKAERSRMEPTAEAGTRKGPGGKLGKAGNRPYTGTGAFHRQARQSRAG